MTTITSLSNDKVRLVRALQSRRRVRQQEGRFVIEGVRLGEEALRAGATPHFVLFTPAARQNRRAATLLDAWSARQVTLYEVSEAVMAACSDTTSPAGVLAVVPMPDVPPPEHPTLALVLDGLRDPGNLGTILRTALAAGVELVLLTPGTVEATHPKVVRAGAGAHFRLPIAAPGWAAITQMLRGCRTWLAAAQGERIYSEVDWRGRTALIIGGEAGGASERARVLAQETISIPMAAGVESLNAAVAAAVILFEAARQRRTPPSP